MLVKTLRTVNKKMVVKIQETLSDKPVHISKCHL